MKFYDVKILHWMKFDCFDFAAASELGATGIY